MRGYSSIARAGRLDDGGNRFAMSALEKYGAIWLSFAATPKPIFDLPEFLEPVRRVVSAGATRIHVSGLRAIENFLDMAHFPFVHTDILGAEPLTEVEPYKVEIDPLHNEIVATECRFAQPKASATALEPIATQYIYRVTRPYVAILYKTCPPDPARWDVLCLFVQPVEEEWCIAHTIMCYMDAVNSEGPVLADESRPNHEGLRQRKTDSRSSPAWREGRGWAEAAVQISPEQPFIREYRFRPRFSCTWKQPGAPPPGAHVPRCN